jgi:hypothetical protein
MFFSYLISFSSSTNVAILLLSTSLEKVNFDELPIFRDELGNRENIFCGKLADLKHYL